MPNYQNGKIYCIRSFKTDDIYIGSTTRKLSSRMSDHRSSYKKWINGKDHYMTSFELIKQGDAYIELLELYPCNIVEELCKKEGEYIRNMVCINKVIPDRTRKEYKKEWNEKNKEHIKEYQKEYRSIPEIKEKYKQYSKDYEKRDYVIKARQEKNNNPDIIKHKHDYQKKYYEHNKEKLKNDMKQYRQKPEVKEKLKQQNKQWREKNKEEYNKKRREKINCLCGSVIQKNDIRKHERTQKHIQFIQSQN